MKGLFNTVIIAALLTSAIPSTSKAEIGFKTKVGLGVAGLGLMYTGCSIARSMWNKRAEREARRAELEKRIEQISNGQSCQALVPQQDYLNDEIKKYNEVRTQQPSFAPFTGQSYRLDASQAPSAPSISSLQQEEKKHSEEKISNEGKVAGFDLLAKIRADQKVLDKQAQQNTAPNAAKELLQGKKASVKQLYAQKTQAARATWASRICPNLPESRTVKIVGVTATIAAALGVAAYWFWGK